MDIKEILSQVKEGTLAVEEAERFLSMGNYEEMGYAKLDMSRKERTGFAEVVFCSKKADSHLMSIYERLYEREGRSWAPGPPGSSISWSEPGFPRLSMTLSPGS